MKSRKRTRAQRQALRGHDGGTGVTTSDRFRAAFTIAIDPIDLEHGFRQARYRTGCARCGRPRDARGPKGGLRQCCAACLTLMKLYRVYGADEARTEQAR